jgi:translation initiation factor 2 alpha subunit (eIF-2alpha)
MVSDSQLSRRRIRSVSKLIRPGKMDVLRVLRVDRQR